MEQEIEALNQQMQSEIKIIRDKYNKLEIKPLKNSSIYHNLGLKELDTNNKLIFFQFDCKHDEFKLPKCFYNKMLLKKIVPYL